jgi:hypothetical protein
MLKKNYCVIMIIRKEIFMKKQTPMNRMQHDLKEIKSLLDNYLNIFELVKKKPRYSYHFNVDSPGVRDDYILVFKNEKTKKSFAFIINYTEKVRDENGHYGQIMDPSDWRVVISVEEKSTPKSNYIYDYSLDSKQNKDLRENKKVIVSKVFDFFEFKESLKTLNKVIKLEGSNQNDIFIQVENGFELSKVAIEKKEHKSKIKDFMCKKIIFENIVEQETSISDLTKKLEIDIENLNKEHEKSDNNVALIKMKKDLENLQLKVNKEKTTLMKKFKIEEQKKIISKNVILLKNSELNIKKDLSKEMLNIPDNIKREISSDFEEDKKKRISKLGMK